MSFGTAVRQREEMIASYQALLKVETNLERITDIENQIRICESEIVELKKGKPLFGKPKPLVKESKLIEKDPENPGEQKITVLNPQPVTTVSPSTAPKRLGNKLRSTLKYKQAMLAEESLKNKIQAAKAAKKVN